MSNKITLILFIFLLLPPALCGAKGDDTISGQLITGYRVLDIPPGSKTVHFTVYRGDYIKFRFPKELGPQPFSAPTLKAKATLNPDPDKSTFFKMKTTGTFPFTLGDISGTITVKEFVRPDYTELSAEQAAELLRTSTPFILDVRTPWEHKKLFIPGSHLIPIQQLQARIAELEPYRQKAVFVYCATGNRSTVASQILADHGFKKIYNLRYGIYDWARRGFPVSRSAQ